MSLPKIGDDAHIRGFILTKLYFSRLWVKPGNNPRGHTSISNIPKGYPPKYRGEFKKNIDWLRRKGLVVRFPHSGDSEQHICAVLDKSIIEKGLEICNKYLQSVGRPPLNNQLKEKAGEGENVKKERSCPLCGKKYKPQTIPLWRVNLFQHLTSKAGLHKLTLNEAREIIEAHVILRSTSG